MLLAFLNTNGWSEGKWRTLIEEGKNYDVIGVGETGWHDKIEWSEGGWVAIGRGRQSGNGLIHFRFTFFFFFESSLAKKQVARVIVVAASPRNASSIAVACVVVIPVATSCYRTWRVV